LEKTDAAHEENAAHVERDLRTDAAHEENAAHVERENSER